MQKCVTTLCGHSFCERCLEDYLIFKDTCFVCDFYGTKRVLLRDKPMQISFKVDDIINQLVDNCKNKQIKGDWLERQALHLKAQKERQVGELDIDSMVDVRDTDFIWCEGRITLIIEPMDKEAFYVVHFEGKSSNDDEVIYKNSERIARHGTFTSRSDIPHWQRQEGEKGPILRNQMLNVYPLLLA